MTGAGDEGARAVSEALMVNTTLTKLDIGGMQEQHNTEKNKKKTMTSTTSTKQVTISLKKEHVC